LPLRNHPTDLALSFGGKKNASKRPRNKLVGDELIGVKQPQGAYSTTQRQTFALDATRTTRGDTSRDVSCHKFRERY
jgi:hypothetical protein